MGTWLIHRDELTLEQLRAIELSPSEHRVIFGAPGSGKTQVLLHRARYIMDTWQVPPDRFRIFVFNNVLKKYIHAALRLLDLPDNCVMTFDAWCMEYYRTHIPGPLPMIDGLPNFPEIRRRVLQELRGNLFTTPQYDFVLVDEGQDLDGISFEILRRFARHVSVCIDHKQQIYENRPTEADILAKLGLRQRNMSLLEAFRCCPFIVNLSAELIDDPKEREAYKRQSRTFQTEIEAPLLYIAHNFQDEKNRLLEILRIRQLKQETIAIILSTKRRVYGFANAVREAGLEIETPEQMDFTNNTPKIMTYFGAKGLTFDTVLMPRLVNSAFIGVDESRLARLLFVGIARATKWVYLSTCHGQEIRLLKRLKPLQEENSLTIQIGRHGGQDFPDGVQEPPETGGILDLL